MRERDPLWRKVGLAALRRPVVTLVAVGGVLVVCAFGLSVYKEDVNVVGQFRTDSESVQGFHLLSRSFPPGTLLPNTVLIDNARGVSAADIAAVTAAVRGVPGVAAVSAPTGKSRDGDEGDAGRDVRRRPVLGHGARIASRRSARGWPRSAAAGARSCSATGRRCGSTTAMPRAPTSARWRRSRWR